MKWKEIAEFVGISAIVASLVFVGLQMRQAQRIAIAETYQQQAGVSIMNSEVATLHAELVAKANRGESLSDAEAFSLSEFVKAKWQDAYFSRMRSEFLDRFTDGPVNGFGDFLCKNPGLREHWNGVSDDLRSSSQGGPIAIFAIDVDAYLNKSCAQ